MSDYEGGRTEVAGKKMARIGRLLMCRLSQALPFRLRADLLPLGGCLE